MIVKAEIVEDKVFLLTADGRIWRVQSDPPRGLLIQKMGSVDRSRVDALLRPTLLLDDEWRR